MKSGFVSIIGRTNAGKSSLLNYLIGEKISMVSHKVNATRRKINGIVMNGEDQIIFIDTPGLHESKKLMNSLMIDLAIKSIGDCDVVVFVASVHDDTKEYEKFLQIERKVPHIVVLSKIDEVKNGFLLSKLSQYSKFKDEFSALIPMSIKSKTYAKSLLDEISKLLPEHEYFYDPELISSTNLRDIYRDFILEAIFESVSSELPYSTDVLIEKIDESSTLLCIDAKIITDTNSHKMILIGKDADTIKRIGIKARKKILSFCNVKTFVRLTVQVKKEWQKQENSLKSEFIY